MNTDIYIWDVGHGLSVTVISPFINAASGYQIGRRRVVQIDAGSNFQTNFFPSKHLVNIKNLSVIDCLILTHPDKDHIDDLVNIDELMKLNKLKVLTLLRNRTIPINEISEDKTEETEAKSVYRKFHQRYTGEADQYQKLLPENFGGITFKTTYLDFKEGMNINNASVVVNIEFAGTHILIAGDLEADGAKELISLGKLLKPDENSYKILIAPHHGSETAEPVDLLNHFNPHIVLASVEEGNEHTDNIYSCKDYVKGFPIIKSDGIVERNCKFNGTKGEAIHIEIPASLNQILGPTIKRISYKQPKQSYPELLRTIKVNLEDFKV
ncbi:MAG: hypothetical protein M1308_21795 [Actinobacteria bacterium]|nr:hypothetical protein [Actinomycetota bacterium]